MSAIYRSMIPSRPGDRAVFVDGEDEIVEPIVMWAIVEDGSSHIVGMIISELGIEPADESVNFVGYIDEGAGNEKVHELCIAGALANRPSSSVTPGPRRN